jgi:hypothetical protein
MGKVIRLTETDLVRLVKRILSEQPTTQNNTDTQKTIVPCSELGVKFNGKCHAKSKKPVKPCGELGTKTTGWCFVDNKQSVSTYNERHRKSINENDLEDYEVNQLEKEWHGDGMDEYMSQLTPIQRKAFHKLQKYKSQFINAAYKMFDMSQILDNQAHKSDATKVGSFNKFNTLDDFDEFLINLDLDGRSQYPPSL